MDPRGPVGDRATEPLTQLGAKRSDEGTESRRPDDYFRRTDVPNVDAAVTVARFSHCQPPKTQPSDRLSPYTRPCAIVPRVPTRLVPVPVRRGAAAQLTCAAP